MNYPVAKNNEISHLSSAGQGLFAQVKLSQMLVQLEELLEVTKPATSTIAAKQRLVLLDWNGTSNIKAQPHCSSQRPTVSSSKGGEGNMFFWSQLSTAPPSSSFLEIKKTVCMLLQIKPPSLPDGSSFSGISVTGEGRTAPHPVSLVQIHLHC